MQRRGGRRWGEEEGVSVSWNSKGAQALLSEGGFWTAGGHERFWLLVVVAYKSEALTPLSSAVC